MRGRDYWERRMTNAALASERSVLEYEQMLLQAYELALIEIRKEIDSFFQKYAKDNKIPYAEARRRLTLAEKKSFETLLKEWYSIASENGYSAEYKQYLQELGKKVYITRLESLEASIRHEIEKLKNKQHEWMSDLMATNYMAGYYTAYYNVAQGIEVSVKFATVNKTGIERAIKERWDGRNYSDSIWNDKAKLIQAIQTILPRSFSMGLNSTTLGDMLAKELNVSKNRGRALARTEINYLYNQATLDVYKACGVEKYQFLATLDMRTSEICRGMDGFIGYVSQAKVNVNYPPMHVNCRSTTIPYFEDDDALDRIAKDERGNNIKVPRRMTQEEWIKKYAPEEQRAKLLKFQEKYSRDE